MKDKWNENGLGRPVERTIDRARTAQLAHQLSTVALQQQHEEKTERRERAPEARS